MSTFATTPNTVPTVATTTLRVGVIEGRHTMPVDLYLLSQADVDAAGFHGRLFEAARKAMMDLIDTHCRPGYPRQGDTRTVTKIVLYPTGLTNAVLGAVSGHVALTSTDAPGCQWGIQPEHCVRLHIASFDRESGQYEEFSALV